MTDEVDEKAMHQKCARDRCHCVPTSEGAVADGKSVYCSRGCMEGTGCTHEECNCATET